MTGTIPPFTMGQGSQLLGVQPAFLRGRLQEGGLGVDLALVEAPTVVSPRVARAVAATVAARQEGFAAMFVAQRRIAVPGAYGARSGFAARSAGRPPQ